MQDACLSYVGTACAVTDHMANPQQTNSGGATDATVKQSGDNRRLGDQDGNKTAGDSKSPGANDPADESPAAKDSNKQ